MAKRLVVVSLVMLAIAGSGWAFVNPSGRFGISHYGVTTYSRLPVPVFDLQVRDDGATRWVWKTHDIDADRLAWILQSKPQVLIVGLGWSGSARAAKDLKAPAETKVMAVPTDEALSLFNSLREQGVRVAIHVHSTC